MPFFFLTMQTNIIKDNSTSQLGLQQQYTIYVSLFWGSVTTATILKNRHLTHKITPTQSNLSLHNFSS